ncbi:hypothetical protein ACF1BE_19875 [Streptomyces sp. NPDC014991]|uniref:hypothetical protein n=1 Tax=Streptomyces sp. NPDC014991 TaxID=3364935 RepID=UPI0036F60F1A
MHARTLPRHARTGQLALGWRKPRPGEDGPQPIWPILGGAPDDGGGDQGGDGGAGDGGDQGGDGDGSGTGDGDDGDQGGDGGANDEVEKWKAQARKHERRAKENAAAAKELERLRREGMSETEAAVAAARAEERRKGGERIARSAFLAAAKGRITDPAEVVEDINLARYVDDDGEVDDDAIAKLVDKLAPTKSGKDDEEDDDQDERDTRRRRRPGGGYQGARNGSGRGKTRRGEVDASALFEDLLGRKPRTTSNP